jgi:hypothetical protein
VGDRMSSAGRKSGHRPLNASISARHSETLYREWRVLPLGEINDCRGKRDNAANHDEVEIGPSGRFQQGYKWYLDQLVGFWEMSIG